MPADEYALLLAHFVIEKREADREAAKQKSKQSLRTRRR